MTTALICTKIVFPRLDIHFEFSDFIYKVAQVVRGCFENLFALFNTGEKRIANGSLVTVFINHFGVGSVLADKNQLIEAVKNNVESNNRSFEHSLHICTD